RASHIKPWRSSSDDERLDPQNGLPLVATLDALFDSGLICFDPAGALVASRRLPAAERSVLRLDGAKLTRYPTEKTQKYLAFHHSNVFRG
ncbi:MAG TPA: HNH endonuclease signature motif containing protein, partial [Longimicrobiaceae bacterium]|nr:HNH endonuclease signature motif containing protein [Longimicrobiaceae bacterium]